MGNVQGSRARDSQRSKLYDAEDLAIRLDSNPRFRSLAEMETETHRILALPSVSKPYPEAGMVNRVIDLTDGRGRRSACAFPTAVRMAFPVFSRNGMILCHELAHILCYYRHGDRGVAWHGWQFAEIYLQLVGAAYGKELHGALLGSFRNSGVKHKPPSKRTLTPERREALRQRMSEVRAAKALT